MGPFTTGYTLSSLPLAAIDYSSPLAVIAIIVSIVYFLAFGTMLFVIYTGWVVPSINLGSKTKSTVFHMDCKRNGIHLDYSKHYCSRSNRMSIHIVVIQCIWRAEYIFNSYRAIGYSQSIFNRHFNDCRENNVFSVWIHCVQHNHNVWTLHDCWVLGDWQA